MAGGDGNLADLVRRSAARRPDATALLHNGNRTTWSDLDATVDAAASAFVSELGLSTGDRVALCLSNTPDYVTAYFGVLRAGLVVVPVNTGYTSREMTHLLGEADVRVVIAEEATLLAVRGAADTSHRAVLDEAGFRDLVAAGRSGGDVEPDAGGEDLAVLLFTSGTSGRPKGAMLSHRALLANLEQCARIEPPPMRSDDVVLLVLPLFHIYGLNAGLGMVALTGATAVLVERFDPRETLELVRRERVTNIPGAPPMYVAWAELAGGADPVDVAEALRDVRLLASGASPLPPAVLEQIRTGGGVSINEGYGLTETSPVVSSTLGSAEAKPGSVGRPIPGVELRLVDESGEDVQDDDAGEIWVRGDNVFSGYWPDGSGGPDEQGWYATGDVAYADEDGDLFLVGRRKELILVSGFNVYPREIEDAISEHPDVAESAVVGVAHEQTGEAVKAYVVARPGSGLTAEDVIAHTAERLARFKQPTIVELVAELPHSVTGKVAKGRLRDADENSVDAGSDPGAAAP
ncbi:MAG: AMP-binding protein [Sporichthyaceae bacterium]